MIQLAQLSGAEIYATVGNEEKKRFLIERYGLSDDHIFSSRNTDFYHGIMKSTGGKGIEVVLNTLTHELLDASWRLCADFGRFIEMGKQDILENAKLDMTIFRRGVSFSAFDMGMLYGSERPDIKSRPQQ